MTSYLVCATPRSGSTLLCRTLERSGVAGHPLEFFEALPETGAPRRPLDYMRGLEDQEALRLVERAPPHPAPWYSDLRGCAAYAEHLANVRRWGTSENGVFGAKIMWAHLQDLAAQVSADPAYRGLPLPELVDALFDRPRFVWVRRRDSVRQAVSLWRAMQTQSWRSENEPPPACEEPQYSFPAVRHLVDLLRSHDAAWESFFAAAGVDPLALTYEDVAADLPGALARTLAHIGVQAPSEPLAAVPSMRRQADERSDAWTAAYARDAGALL